MHGHCSDHTLCAVTTVYAKGIFAGGNTDSEQLPLEALYDHIDYVDLISAREFGIEALFPSRCLLCVAMAKRADALQDMEAMILGVSTENQPLAVAQAQDDTICVQIGNRTYSIANEKTAAALYAALSASELPCAAWLGVLGVWCTGYRVVVCGEEGSW